MKRHAHSVFWFIYWGSALFVALLAVLLLVIRVWVQDISDYRQGIEKQLSEQLNARVHLADIKGSWIGPDPVIEINSFSVDGLGDQSELSLVLLEGVIALDTWASVKQLAPILSRFDLSGLTVRYDLAKKGQSPLPDEAEDPSKISSRHDSHSDSTALLQFLLQQSALKLDQARIIVHQSDGKELSVAPIQLSLEHDGQLHQLKASADLVAETGIAAISFIAEVEGNPRNNATDFYLNISDLDHHLLNPWLAMAGLELGELSASQKIWGELDKGKLTYVTGETIIEEFKYGDYAFSDFSLHTALIRRDRGYQLQLRDLIVSGGNLPLQLPEISMDFVRDEGSWRPGQLMADEIDLHALSEWALKQNYLPEDSSSILATLAPQGMVRNLNVSWADSGTLKDFSLQGDLEQVGISAWDDVPEIRGINGLIKAGAEGGAIHLQSEKFAMMYPTLFDYRWDYDFAKGVIGWRFEDKGVVVASQLLNLRNKSVSASGRFSIYLPFDNDEQPLLNLQIGMQNSDGLQAKYYIPPEEVGHETYNWLVEAIKAGHINQAGFILNGVTRTRLDDYQMPAVQMFFNVADAEFEYQPGWPGIKGADTFVFFRNGELVVEAQGGHIYESDIGTSWVHLPQSTDKLFIAGNVKGDAQDLHRLLTKSPLRHEVGSDLDEWAMSGQAETLVDINLPLIGTKLPDVKVSSSIVEGEFSSQSEGIDFSNILGTVNYDSLTGLSSKSLTARLFEQPVTANIKSSSNKTEVFINGSVESAFLRDWLDLDLLRIAKGKLKYNARLDLCPGKSCNQLVINSDMKGVSLEAPTPFAKSADKVLPLIVVSDLGRTYKDNRSVVRLNLNDQLRAIMISKGQEVERAKFTFGGAKPEIPAQAGIWIDGSVLTSDYDDLSRFLHAAGLVSEGQSRGSNEPSKSGNLLRQVSVSVKRFTVDNFALENLWVELSPQKDGWLLALDSPQASGTVLLPERNIPYKVHLRHLTYTSEEDSTETGDEQLEYSVDPAELPEIDFVADQVTLNDKPMGRWSFAMRPTAKGAQLEDIKASLEGAEMNGNIRWDMSGQEVTDLTVKLSSADFGRVIKAWGYDKAIETKALDSYLQLSWPGAPWDFVLGRTDGELQFTAKQGRLLDVGSSGNILRVFGILNLQSLGRRLRLDFSDLVKSGVAFDQMKAQYKIKQGVASTTEPFVMTGPSANLAMQGSLDLVKETVDKDIEVALPVTGNIPLVSVLLGAPQVAGAVFLFDKIIGDPFEKFTTVKYHMSGDWSDPEIKLEQKRKNEPEKQEGNAFEVPNGH